MTGFSKTLLALSNQPRWTKRRDKCSQKKKSAKTFFSKKRAPKIKIEKKKRKQKKKKSR